MINILIYEVIDEYFSALKKLLSKKFNFKLCRNAEKIEEELRAHSFDIILFRIQNRNEISLISQISNNTEAPPIICLSSIKAIEVVVEAIRNGACNFIKWPVCPENLNKTINTEIINSINSKDTNNSMEDFFSGFIGEDSSIHHIKNLVKRYSATKEPVLICGENGTGKEIIAQIIHNNSQRAFEEFTAINCGALPETLIESELFGCEKGAFTDSTNKKGLFEHTDKGTLFLDEITELSNKAQAKLLRAVESKEIKRIGSLRIKKVDIRLIAATNKDLAYSLGDGSFREDLFYRISVLNINIPPLRKRKSDIVLIAYHILKKLDSDKKLSDNAVKKLIDYNWPGNVRQLKNVLIRANILENSKIIKAKNIKFLT